MKEKESKMVLGQDVEIKVKMRRRLNEASWRFYFETLTQNVLCVERNGLRDFVISTVRKSVSVCVFVEECECVWERERERKDEYLCQPWNDWKGEQGIVVEKIFVEKNENKKLIFANFDHS